MKVILLIFVVLGVSKTLPDSKGNQEGHNNLENEISDENKMSADNLRQHMIRNLQNMKDEKQKAMLESKLKNIPDNKLRDQMEKMNKFRNTGKTADTEHVDDMSIEEMRQHLMKHLEKIQDHEKRKTAAQKLQRMSDNEVEERIKGMRVADNRRHKRSKEDL